MEQRKSLSIFGKKDAKKLSNATELQDVTFLDIKNASELEVDFSLFPLLKELWISSKQDYQFPSSFVKLKQLDLDVGCSLSDLALFPDLSGLTKLKRLRVRGESVQGQRLSQYSLFPQVLESIKGLKNLESLDLCFWRSKKKSEWLVVDNKRHSIPNIFDRYPKLKELSLSGMKLDFIPSTVFGLKNLKHLFINDNNLDSDVVLQT